MKIYNDDLPVLYGDEYSITKSQYYDSDEPWLDSRVVYDREMFENALWQYLCEEHNELTEDELNAMFDRISANCEKNWKPCMKIGE